MSKDQELFSTTREREIKKALIDQGLRQREFALAAGVTPQHLSHVIKGQRRNKRLARHLCQRLGLEYEALFDDVKKRVAS